MMVAGVNHLPVVDERGNVVGILSASNLMTLDARSPFALRRSIQSAATENDLVRTPPATCPSSSSTCSTPTSTRRR